MKGLYNLKRSQSSLMLSLLDCSYWDTGSFWSFRLKCWKHRFWYKQ